MSPPHTADLFHNIFKFPYYFQKLLHNLKKTWLRTATILVDRAGAASFSLLELGTKFTQVQIR